ALISVEPWGRGADREGDTPRAIGFGKPNGKKLTSSRSQLRVGRLSRGAGLGDLTLEAAGSVRQVLGAGRHQEGIKAALLVDRAQGVGRDTERNGAPQSLARHRH